MKKIISLLFLVVALHPGNANTNATTGSKLSAGSYISIVHYRGKQLYSYVKITGANSELWFRSAMNKVASSDMKVATISFARKTLDEMNHVLCKSFEIYDNLQAVKGCAETNLAIFDAVEVLGTAEVGGPPDLEYELMAIEQGLEPKALSECLSGITDALAAAFDASAPFLKFNQQQHFLNKDGENLIKDGMKEMCALLESKLETEDHPRELGDKLSHGNKNTSHPPAHTGVDGPPVHTGHGTPHVHPGGGAGLPSPRPTPPVSSGTTPGGSGDIDPFDGPSELDPVPSGADDSQNDWEGGGGTIMIPRRRSRLMDFHVNLTEPQKENAKGIPSDLTKPGKQIPDSVFIKKNTARLIAKAYLYKTYGKADIMLQEPYQQVYLNGFWIITGTPYGNLSKHGFKILIDAATGEITSVSNE